MHLGVCRAAYNADAGALVRRANLEMLCLTWNVNEQRPEGSPLFNWIADLSGKASIAVLALQEIEMGSSSVAIAAAKDVLNKSAQVCLSSLLQRGSEQSDQTSIRLLRGSSRMFHCKCISWALPLFGDMWIHCKAGGVKIVSKWKRFAQPSQAEK